MDPLAILKDFTVSGQVEQVAVDRGGGRVLFADKYSFPADTPTAFRSSRTGELYSLMSVATFIKTMRAGGMSAYMQVVGTLGKGQQGMATIEVADRRPLEDYLTGKISHCANLADVVPAVPLEPVAKKARVAEPEADSDAAKLQDMFGHEKQLRDRNSLLCAPGANFKSVLHMVDTVLAVRKQVQDAAARAGTRAGGTGRPQQAAAGRAPGAQQAAQQQQSKQHQFMKSSARMERQVDVKGQLKALGADATVAAAVGLGYGISAPSGGAAAAAAAAPPAPAAAAAPPGGSGGHRSSSSSKQAGGGPRPAAGGSSGRHGSSRSGGDAAAGGGSEGQLKPLILVPQGITALINMFNARQFLEHGKFVTSEEVRQDNSVKPSGVLEFPRTALRPGPRYPRYQITDKPPTSSADWKRVVAVIVLGKPWQFKAFPFKGAAKGDMVDTFNHVFGAFLHYSDEEVPAVVQGWNVARLPLRRTARHLDQTVMMEFYEKLDAFLVSKRRTDLAY